MAQNRPVVLATVGLLLSVLVLTGSAQAQYTWPHWKRTAASGEGDFFTSTNWTTHVPTSTETCSIDNGGSAYFNKTTPGFTYTVSYMYLGYGNNNLSGFMRHPAGTLKVTNGLYLISKTGKKAVYTLDGGSLETGNTWIYGVDTDGSTFRHTAGSATTRSLYVGNDVYYTGPQGGAYEMGIGGGAVPTLTAGSAFVNSLSIFNQSGGSTLVDQYTLNGTHRLFGGTLEVTRGLHVDGTLDFDSGPGIVVAGDALVDLSHATIANGAGGSFTSGPKSMVVLPPGFNPAAFGAGFFPGNLTHTAGSPMNIAAGEQWEGWGNVVDHLNCLGMVTAPTGGGIYLLDGVNVGGDGLVHLGSGDAIIEDATSGMTGGSLTANYLYIARTTPGTFTMTGGHCSVTNVRISDEGSGTGSADGTLSVGGDAVLESTTGIWIGFDGNGFYDQSGGSVTTHTFTVGFGNDVTGEMTMTGGYLKTGPVRIADCGRSSATVTQSGGHWDCTGASFMNLATDLNTTATYHLTGDAVLDSARLTVGNKGVATFNQSGSSIHNINDEIRMASNTESYYNMMGGQLNVSLYIALYNAGVSEFNHTGGTVNADEIRMGPLSYYSTSGFGTYNLSDTGHLVANKVNVGLWTNGEFLQTGGTCTVNGPLRVGAERNYYGNLGQGTYELSGTGSIVAVNTFVGDFGVGTFNQSAGSHTIAGALVIGQDSTGEGTYVMSGGTLSTADLVVGSDGVGTLNITDPAADISVGNVLSIGSNGVVQAVPGAVIHMTGSAFENHSTTPANVAGLANVELVFEGGAGVTDKFELAGKPIDQAGGNPNFEIGTLTIGGANPGHVQFVDEVDNQPGWAGTESLHVAVLTVGPGSVLDLNGHDLYCDEINIDPTATVLGGTPIFSGPFAIVAEVAPVWVYQNARNATGDDDTAATGHRATLTVTVTDDTVGNSSYTMTVTQTGPGVVRVFEGATSLDRVLKGSFRTDGVTGTGLCSLHVEVAGNVEGTASADTSIMVRPLGDIDDNGAVTTADSVELTKRLNNVVAGDDIYDLDASGAVTTSDRVLLTKILNNIGID